MTPLDAARAWRLLLALRRAGRPAAPLHLDAEGRAVAEAEALLTVAPEGAWRLHAPAAPEAALLLDLHLGFALADAAAPATLGHLGQSLDGMIATAEGRSHYVTGPENLDHLHRLRALADAVIVGAGTVATDDPQLTVRRVEGPSPVRVVIDPRGRLGAERKVFADGAAPSLRVGPPAGLAEGLDFDLEDGEVAPGDLIGALHGRGLNALLVEGGGETVSRFLRAGALDRLQVTVAPLLIGAGRPGLTLPGVGDLDQALRPPSRRFPMGADVLFDLDLRSAAGPAGRGGRP